MNKYILFFVVIAILGTALVLLTQKTSTPEITTTPDETQASVEEAAFDAVVSLNHPAGATTTITKVMLTNPGFVTIHVDENGKPGTVLGNSLLLPEGTYANVVISLSRPSTEGEPLYAMLHTDNGNGIYEFPGPDAPLTDEQGNTVMMKYVVGNLDHGYENSNSMGTMPTIEKSMEKKQY